jgi:hypothetical protein|tara:strand:- start:1945 stop:3084 length:1140 start_codon:yes stop_codon:yes gene_type:complete
MTINEIKSFLKEKPGYLKKSAEVLSGRLECDVELCETALYESRKQAKEQPDDNANNNESVINEFQTFLDTNGISPEDVTSVKFWQTMSGKQRFSVVTKNESKSMEDFKKEIEEFATKFSPYTEKYTYEIPRDPVAYEISLPDIHYGKLHNFSLEEVEKQFMHAVVDLVLKADGLDIERFILPIGNDGMNSEGMRMSTTKGTPQQDNAGWKATFTGYWNLMVKAINYLKGIAPVDVIVISGNHDFERMFYAGDVISGWFRNDAGVTVDNASNSRKYYEYGNNMLMFTHGDKEKTADMPLIMATEQPEMFARTTSREVHCGHLHKEMVNEYRGIKVRFLPSICPNDEWHKQMGYEAKRTGQAYIWNKQRGLEGYLQTNVRI